MDRYDISVVENAVNTSSICQVNLYDKVIASCMKDYLEYRKAEEQGLLLRLPCKVGDIIYHVEDGYIYEFKAKSIEIRKENEEYIFCIDSMDYTLKDFGQIVFLSQEEAEIELANIQQICAEIIMDERNGK